jgi:nitrite reductase (NADH) large subunit
MSGPKSVVARHAVVVGHGMVGHRFVEALRDRDRDGCWSVTVVCEEPTPAYDRVALSSYVGSWDRSALAMAGNDYAGDDLVQLRVGERVTTIDREARTVTTSAGAR